MENPSFKTEQLQAAKLSPALSARFLTAMQSEALQVRANRSIEEKLQRLSPAPVPAPYKARLTNRMQMRQAIMQGSKQAPTYWGQLGAAASLIVLGCSAMLMLGSYLAGGTGPELRGEICRNLINSSASTELQWDSSQQANSTYKVTYEDSFVLETEENETIVVTVPVEMIVAVSEDVI